MCGIAGMVRFTGNGVEDILNMNQAMYRRGPDAGDYFLDEKERTRNALESIMNVKNTLRIKVELSSSRFVGNQFSEKGKVNIPINVLEVHIIRHQRGFLNVDNGLVSEAFLTKKALKRNAPNTRVQFMGFLPITKRGVNIRVI